MLINEAKDRKERWVRERDAGTHKAFKGVRDEGEEMVQRRERFVGLKC